MKLSYAFLWAASLVGLTSSALHAQAPAWTRFSRITGPGLESGSAIAADAAGNTYLAGQFSSAAITIGSTTLSNADASNTSDIFVVKYNPAGAALWARRLGGSGNDEVNALAVDATGNVFLAGTFFGSVTVGGTTLAANGGGRDMLLAKLNAQGVPQWGMRAGGALNDVGAAVALDDQGYVWLGGTFQGTASVTGTNNTLVSAGGFDQALIKFDASTGSYTRMNREGGTGNEYLEGIATAGSAIYATGYFEGATMPVAGGSTLTRRCQERDGYLVKYSQVLTLEWARSEGATGSASYANYAIAADADGTVTTAGEFRGTIIAGSFTTIVNTGASPSPMFVRYAAAGNVTTARGGGSMGSGRATSVVRDTNGDTYASGYFTGTLNWSLTSVTSMGNNDVFVVKQPTTGNALWVAQSRGTGNEQANGMALDGAGILHFTGSYTGSAAFGALPILANVGQASAFVTRLGGTLLASRATQTAAPLEAYPNPLAANRILHLTLPAARRGTTRLRLLDVTGRLAHEQAVPAGANPALLLPATLAPGRYQAEVQAEGLLLRRALLVQ